MGSNAEVTGSIPKTGQASDEAMRRTVEQLGKRYEANPQDKAAALDYAQALRKRAQYEQAVAVLQGVAIRNAQDKDILGAYGKALADAGRLDQAAEVLSRAHTPDRPNWSILSAQGAVADRMGDHANAQNFYRTALKIAPGEPSVLSNLGLSYALTKQLPQAEQALRQAAASPRADARVRQNLALVLSLEGDYNEAEALGRQDLTPEQAAENVALVRRMTAQSDTWKDLRSLDRAKPRVAARAPASARTTTAQAEHAEASNPPAAALASQQTTQ